MADARRPTAALPQGVSEFGEFQRARSPGRRALIAITFVLWCLFWVFVLAYVFLPALGSPSGQAVAHSLVGDVGGWDSGPCQALSQDVRKCGVWDDSQSGVVTYHVALDGHCWMARRVPPHGLEAAPEGEARAEGCVRLGDQLRVFERAFGHPLGPN